MATKRWRKDDWVWTAQGNQTLWEALLGAEIPKKSIAELVHNKAIFLNGNRKDTHTSLENGDEIRIQFPKEKLDYTAVEMDLVILYEDDDLLIIDKPKGLTVNSKGQISMANGIAAYFEKEGIRRKVRFLNRLDRDTSGILVIAKSAIAQGVYQKQIEDGRFEKWYEALVEGELKGEETLELGMMKCEDGPEYMVHPKGKITQTFYKALETVEGNTRILVKLLTGKTHQIRVAMSYIGHPLHGDVLYGGQETAESFSLRAYEVSFNHMRSDEKITIRVDGKI